MRATYYATDLVGARMVLRSEQRPYDCEPLGCDGNPPLMTPRDELAESLNRVSLTPPSIDQPNVSHKSPDRLTALNATDNQRREKGSGG
jgi:hypothetical protein